MSKARSHLAPSLHSVKALQRIFTRHGAPGGIQPSTLGTSSLFLSSTLCRPPRSCKPGVGGGVLGTNAIRTS
eukprot:118366-Prorocentrum_minimum.AAC.1